MNTGCIAFFLSILFICTTLQSFAIQQRDSSVLQFTVVNETQQPVESAVVSVLDNTKNLLKTDLTDAQGEFSIMLANGRYWCVIGYTGYAADTFFVTLPLIAGDKALTIHLQPVSKNLQNVTVTAARQLIQFERGKVVVNVDASPSNAGASILEVLEKSPGVTVDRNGSISLKAKANVLVMIDGKQTFLSGADLNNLLSSMSASQVDQVELIANPSARYDASGNAGIINIKTKKSRQKGFNGNVTTAYSQGRYPKSNNSMVLNYRTSGINTYLNYSYNYNKSYSDLYALRTYTDENGKAIATLDQPTLFKSASDNHSVKSGIDFYVSTKTTVGVAFTGIFTKRTGSSFATAQWLNENGTPDSSLTTSSATNYRLTNSGVNLNARHAFNNKDEISIDLDALHYNISNKQFFVNNFTNSSATDASDGYLPATLKIYTGKVDYTKQLTRGKIEAGWKTSHINTDNLATYQYYDGFTWQPDYNKSNHFIYRENIHAFYANAEQQAGKFTAQAGVRYESTAYKAKQFDNPTRKDSAFTRRYDGLFPSANITWQADSSNSFTVTAGRRIDRPAFQRLNPFVFIINKYTYETGNPYFRPQYSWNLELTHQYKNYLTTTVSYSAIKDYFSQLFLTDSSGILYYSQGNVGKAFIAGLSLATQVSLFKWWNTSTQAVINYKKLDGYVWNNFASSVLQFNISTSNQFRINDSYTAELSGFYTGRSRNDLQEALLPTGQLNIGLSKTILKKKGTLRFNIRDIFHTQVMEGNTDFQNADEYFIIRRDSRVISVAFTYRFGKTFKTTKRSGGAEAEMERVNG